MASINKVILVGNLGRDPDVRTMSNGTVVTQFSLATTRKYKSQDGQAVTETEWHRIAMFGRLAEIARDYLKKGSCCYVEGRLRTRKYTDQQGIERYTTEIICEMLQLLDKRSDSQAHAAAEPAPQSRPAPQPARQQAAPKPAQAPADHIADEDIPF